MPSKQANSSARSVSGKRLSQREDHPSVLALLREAQGNERPRDIIRRKCREMVTLAKSHGWSGPPFDPAILAGLNGIKVEETDEPFDGDGRIFPRRGQVVIQYRKGQMLERQRFTICHELAHTCFPDAFERVRCSGRTDSDAAYRSFERLCDIGAAELLLPREEFTADLNQRVLSLPHADELRQRYLASIDATVIRCVSLTDHRCTAAFLTDSAFDEFTPIPGRPRVKYCFPSSSFTGFIPSGTLLPANSAVLKAADKPLACSPPPKETWWISGKPYTFYVEAMGLPAIPENREYPKVLALLHSRLPRVCAT